MEVGEVLKGIRWSAEAGGSTKKSEYVGSAAEAGVPHLSSSGGWIYWNPCPLESASASSSS